MILDCVSGIILYIHQREYYNILLYCHQNGFKNDGNYIRYMHV